MTPSRYDDVMQEALHLARPSRLPWVLVVVALAAGGALAVLLLRRLDGVRSEAAAAGAKVLDLQQSVAALRTSRAEAEAQLERLEAERAGLLARQSALSRDVQVKEEEVARLQGTARDLQDKLRSEIEKGEVLVSEVNGRLKVELVDQILFDSGEAQVSRHGEEVLSRVGGVLAKVEGKLIQVAGHTDVAPISTRLVDRYPTNWELSVARATNVVRFLEEKAHVPARRLVASGYGPYHPIASNATAAGRARNRRIEILLTPAFDPAEMRAEAKAPATRTPGRAGGKKR